MVAMIGLNMNVMPILYHTSHTCLCSCFLSHHLGNVNHHWILPFSSLMADLTYECVDEKARWLLQKSQSHFTHDPIGTIMYQLITNILAPVRMGLDPRKAVWIQLYWNYRMMNIITNRRCNDWVEYECHDYSLPYSSHVLMLMILIIAFG